MNLGFLRGKWRGEGLVELSFGDRGHSMGFEIKTPEGLPYQDWVEGHGVELFVHTHVREDAIEHYGFSTASERSTFRLLITVSGVGPRLAMAMLSKLGASGVLSAISAKDRASLQSVSGVGKKTAEQILLDLHAKVSGAVPVATEKRLPKANDLKVTVTEALLGLGFREADLDRMLSAIESSHWDSESPETLVKLALSGRRHQPAETR